MGKYQSVSQAESLHPKDLVMTYSVQIEPFAVDLPTADATTELSENASQNAPSPHHRLEPKQRMRKFDWSSPWLSIPVVIAVAILLWEGLIRWQGYPQFILPRPAVVWNKLLATLADGTLARHAIVTLSEIGLGLLLGLSLAFILGYALGKNRFVERLLSPYIVASQTVPIVAIAPLLVIWFGSGMFSKVLVCALITFFPTLISTIVGIRNVDADLMDLMRSLRAGRWQIFRLLELPAAAPVIFGGLKLSVILSVVGAVVAEFMGADAGLGFLINLARGVLDTPLMFVAVISLIVIAQMLYLIISLLETICLSWQEQGE